MNFLSVVFIAAKRLWNNKGLTLCAIVGLIYGFVGGWILASVYNAMAGSGTG